MPKPPITFACSIQFNSDPNSISFPNKVMLGIAINFDISAILTFQSPIMLSHGKGFNAFQYIRGDTNSCNT